MHTDYYLLYKIILIIFIFGSMQPSRFGNSMFRKVNRVALACKAILPSFNGVFALFIQNMLSVMRSCAQLKSVLTKPSPIIVFV